MFFLIKRFRVRLGHDKYSAETFDRLIYSMHVQDLHWIVNVTAYAAALAIFVIGLVAAVEFFPVAKWSEALVPATTLLTGLGAVLAILGGIITWCYQTGSSRFAPSTSSPARSQHFAEFVPSTGSRTPASRRLQPTPCPTRTRSST
jgi:hypothetical protein